MQVTLTSKLPATSEKAPGFRSNGKEERRCSDGQYLKAGSQNKVFQFNKPEDIIFKNGDVEFKAQFTSDGKLKCFFCSQELKQVKKHINTKHELQIQDKAGLEQFCEEVLRKWKREKQSKYDESRQDKRKSYMKDYDAKRKENEVRKEQMRVSNKKYKGTDRGKAAKRSADLRHQANLGELKWRSKLREYQQTKVEKRRTGGSVISRRIKFQKAVLRGPEYVCSSCHRKLYQKSVTIISERMRGKISEACEETRSNFKAQGSDKVFNSKSKPKQSDDQEDLLKIKSNFKAQGGNKVFHSNSKPKQTDDQEDLLKMLEKHQVRSVDNLFYLCSTCKSSLLGGKMPSMAVGNGLGLSTDPECPQLTELENNLIAKTINFQKIVLLHRSRWLQGQGKMISVPVKAHDIMNTMKQLPRLPSEAGLVAIKLKRKKQYKGHVRHELIRPEMVFKALRYLRKAGHPLYQYYDSEEDYWKRLEEKDKRGFMLLTGTDDLEEEDLETLPVNAKDTLLPDEAPEEEDGDRDINFELDREEEEIQDDPVRRNHFNYSEFSCLVNGSPEIFLDDNGNQAAPESFAPAEGKKPVNFLDQSNWDISSFPTLFPDGKFGKDYKRTKKLTAQEFFQQRILNKDDRFSKNPGFCFAAMSYVEAERLRSNANLTGMKGKRVEGTGGISYEVGDPCTVFEKVKGTPKYFQKAKYDMISKFENIGPFQVRDAFFTSMFLFCCPVDNKFVFSSSSHSPVGTCGGVQISLQCLKSLDARSPMQWIGKAATRCKKQYMIKRALTLIMYYIVFRLLSKWKRMVKQLTCLGRSTLKITSTSHSMSSSEEMCCWPQGTFSTGWRCSKRK